MNDQVRVTYFADGCNLCYRLSFVRQNQYPNLNQSLIEANHVWKEEIWFKMTKLEWPQQRTDGGRFDSHLGYRSLDKWSKQSIYEIWKISDEND